MAAVDRQTGPDSDARLRRPPRSAGHLRAAAAAPGHAYSRGAVAFSAVAVFLALALTVTTYIVR